MLGSRAMCEKWEGEAGARRHPPGAAVRSAREKREATRDNERRRKKAKDEPDAISCTRRDESPTCEGCRRSSPMPSAASDESWKAGGEDGAQRPTHTARSERRSWSPMSWAWRSKVESNAISYPTSCKML
ncbi:unnamed protein product [Prorocentrum cordatum]|uniref:Uncharacterized protein n=1 Tax=Prorocentrum cordatum TaxID=2364126 RepID=A0ABN9QBZ8_9DINO|nr:unnamed protein product [Polarella glacialis]